MSSQTKKSKDINPFTLIFGAILTLYILSFIIPSGGYQMVDGAIDPTKFSYIDKSYLWPWDLIRKLGQSSATQFGTLWVNIFATGGAIAILTETGTLDRIINGIVNSLKNKALLLIPVFAIFMFFTGSVGAFINSALALLPIGLIISKKLKVDNVFAFAVVFLSSWAGLWFSGLDPVGLGLAQKIANIPLFSGLTYRLTVGAIAFILIVGYLLWYANRVRRDPSKSAMNVITLNETQTSVDDSNHFTTKDLLVGLVFVGGIVFFGFGAAYWKYSTSEFTGVMLIIALIASLTARLNISQAMGYFSKGAASMIVPVLILIFSQALSIILAETKITHTIIYFLSQPLQPLGGVIAGLGMFVMNGLINMVIYPFVPQIALVMPIMAPLADAVDVSRQTAVLAVQYGAGITDFVTPVNGVLLAGLAIVKASFREWLRFVLPIFSLLLVLMVAALTIAGATGFTGV
jgi:uncharacterized ion transporter superfamily protein YfcC